MHVFYGILILVYTVLGQSVEEIDYYEKLIKEQMDKGKHYRPLWRNSEYIPSCLDVEGKHKCFFLYLKVSRVFIFQI